ncbi:PQQ-dependent sugar dehydrogenase [Alishewanella sp. BS5-314]|uniref:PQQ-dependent sugar dehydrogenase n=1 Tax=Alishewanella sp. BS5-314 TaxID=2755587 RepID=UPI0021BB85A0|nr:PQQ-dependent sugar dehydrogenase [Alishewanella sp. BS5-314]MCT8126438.1 PQQ-dependent sugar dehydrogenase [Alishewanella sp. BS5-314]
MSLNRMLFLSLMLVIAPVALTTEPLAADPLPTKPKVQTLTEGLEYPWSLSFLPSGGFLLTERSGQLVTLGSDGQVLQKLDVNLPDLYAASQGGLLEVLLAEDFAQSGRLFLSYVCGTANANSVCLASGNWQDNQLTDVKQIFRATPDRRGAAHYGGRMVLLPDQSLVLTLGDGFDYREQAQNKTNHLGKIVRLQQNGSVPADNPFVGQAAVAAEIFTLGHRNVQGIVYDTATGKLWSHEHGPKGGDELNLLQAGVNYGWPVATTGIDYTGARISPFTRFTGMAEPVYQWSPSIAPAGMTLYRGEAFPQYQGNILITALAGKALHRLVLDGDKVVEEEKLLTELDSRLRDVRTGPDGLIYILTDGPAGKLLRLTPQ